MKHFIEQYPQRPNIYPIVILSLKEHFRRHVLIGATKGCPFGVDILSTPSKITYLDI